MELTCEEDHLFQEQYIFIHDAILESVICGDTEISLRVALKNLAEKSPEDSTSQLQRQFEVCMQDFQSINSVSNTLFIVAAGTNFS